MSEIFIPGNVPSSKNSKVWTGKFFVMSKIVQIYIKDTELSYSTHYHTFREQVREYPLKVSFKFIRDSKRRFDYVNPLQTVQDLMVKYHWIEDDNADILLPVLEPYEYNKDNPGVLIKIL